MYKDLVRLLEENGKSAHAYERVAAAARAKIPSSPDDAAGLLLIALAAEDFADRFARVAVKNDDIQMVFKAFRQLGDELDVSRGSAEDDYRATVNRFAISIANM